MKHPEQLKLPALAIGYLHAACVAAAESNVVVVVCLRNESQPTLTEFSRRLVQLSDLCWTDALEGIDDGVVGVNPEPRSSWIYGLTVEQVGGDIMRPDPT